MRAMHGDGMQAQSMLTATWSPAKMMPGSEETLMLYTAPPTWTMLPWMTSKSAQGAAQQVNASNVTPELMHCAL